MAQVLDLKFSRVQFTPDLMPSDITGTDIIQEDAETGRRRMAFVPGPLFTNILLADEVNRTPPKTQAALLEAMQERRVTVQGRTYPLDPPFFVFATQNPIELEGTYPLPEAQLDRFLLRASFGYPGREDEIEMLERRAARLEALAASGGWTEAIARELLGHQGLRQGLLVGCYRRFSKTFATVQHCVLGQPELPAHQPCRLVQRVGGAVAK
jgi:MoxR-like ATPase